MPRAKRSVAAHKRHKKVIARAQGFRGRRNNVYRAAKQAVMRADQFAYRDRRQRKRDFRSLWIIRINAAARQRGLTYSQLMGGLRRGGVSINRKMLAELAVANDAAFNEIAALAQKGG